MYEALIYDKLDSQKDEPASSLAEYTSPLLAWEAIMAYLRADAIRAARVYRAEIVTHILPAR